MTHLEEAYTTEHWLVRIYKVKDLSNRPSTSKSLAQTNKKSKRGSRRDISSSSKRGSKEGLIKDRPVVVKGKRKNKAKK